MNEIDMVINYVFLGVLGIILILIVVWQVLELRSKIRTNTLKHKTPLKTLTLEIEIPEGVIDNIVKDVERNGGLILYTKIE